MMHLNITPGIKLFFNLIVFSSLFVSQAVAQSYSGGSGIVSDPFQISNKADLKYLSENSGEWTTYFIQTADITMGTTDFQSGGDFYNGGEGFIPIGDATTNFTGEYDGDGYKIENLYINRTADFHNGLIGYLGSGGVVTKVNMLNVDFTGQSNVGGVVGYNRGTVSKCNASGSVTATQSASGGIVGFTILGTISNSYSLADVTATISRAGGITGYNDTGVLTNCYATGMVTSPSTVGGLVGGDEFGTVNNCFWDTQTSGQSTSAGGTGKTTVEMQTDTTYTGASWDFVVETINGTDDIWQMSSCTNNGYPVFSWQPLNSPTSSTISPSEFCQYFPPSYKYLWTTSGTYVDTIPNAAGCDSIITINLTIIDFADETPSASTQTFCNSDSVTISIPSSQTGVNYYLRNDANDAVVNGPIPGTGSGISFSTGDLTATTTFNIYSEVSPFLNSALDFDGIDDYIQVINDTNFDFTSHVTLEAWIYPHSLSGISGLISKDADSTAHPYQLRLTDDELEFAISSTTIGYKNLVTTDQNIPLNEWTHVAASYDQSNIVLYINGVEVASTALTYAIPTNDQSLEIGRTNDSGYVYFDGVMDEVKVWDTARTAVEIQNNMTNCTFAFGLVGFYKFDGSYHGTTAGDFSENGNTGILTNMDTLSDWVTGSPTQVCSWCNFEMTQNITVTVNSSNSGSENQTSCDSYSWSATGTTYDSSGTYTALLTNIAGCDSVATLNLTINTVNTSVTNSGPTLSANETGAVYQWLDCDSNFAIITNETSQTFTASSSGNYAVVVEKNSCIDTSSCETVVLTAVSENHFSNALRIFPNPSSGLLHIRSGEVIKEISFSDLAGKVIYHQVANESFIKLDTEGMLAPGVYFVEVRTLRGIGVRKVVVK